MTYTYFQHAQKRERENLLLHMTPKQLLILKATLKSE